MEVVYLSVWGVRERTLHAFKWFYDKFGQDPEVIVEPSLYEDEVMIDRLRPDIWLADMENILTAMQHNVPTFEIMGYLPPHMGYEGLARLGMGMASIMRHPMFGEKAKRIQNLEYTNARYLKTACLAMHTANKSCMNEFGELEED
jgi:hypothetical protein